MISFSVRKHSMVPSFAAAPAFAAHTRKPRVFSSAFSAVCRRLDRRLRSAGILLLLLGIVVGARAQTAQFYNWVTAIGGSAVNEPISIALDPSGNLYVVNNVQGTVIPGVTGAVIRIPPSDPTCSTPGDCINVAPSYNSSYYYGDGDYNANDPFHVAVDSAGNVFILIQHMNSGAGNFFVRVPSTDLTCSTPGDCIETPLNGVPAYYQGPLAVDGSDSVYFSGCLPNDGGCGVAKSTLSGNTYTSAMLFFTYDEIWNTGAPVSGIAVDANGNLLLILGGNLVEYALSGGTYTPSTIYSGGSLLQLMVDWSGNVYVSTGPATYPSSRPPGAAPTP